MSDAEEWRAQREGPPDPSEWRNASDEDLTAKLVRVKAPLLEIHTLVKGRDQPEAAARIDELLGGA